MAGTRLVFNLTIRGGENPRQLTGIVAPRRGRQSRLIEVRVPGITEPPTAESQNKVWTIIIVFTTPISPHAHGAGDKGRGPELFLWPLYSHTS